MVFTVLSSLGMFHDIHFLVTCLAVIGCDGMFHLCASIEVIRSVSNNTAR